MTDLSKFWPTAYKVQKSDVAALVLHIVLFVAAGAVASILTSFLFWIPVLGLIITIASALVGLYSLAGIVISILRFCGVM